MAEIVANFAWNKGVFVLSFKMRKLCAVLNHQTMWNLDDGFHCDALVSCCCLVVVVSIACRFDVYPNKLSLVVHSNCANVQQRSILLIYLKGKKPAWITTVRYWIASFVYLCLWYISVSSWGAHAHSQFQISTDRARIISSNSVRFLFLWAFVQCAMCNVHRPCSSIHNLKYRIVK